MKIAVIPARGGSKRIPRKNIKLFCGKPMIAWSIEAAKLSNLFDRIIVSTDDGEIADVAKEWGAEAPFVRPEDLSTDQIGTTAVIAHATQWALNQGYDVTVVCCIYATAPFVLPSDLQLGLNALHASDASFAIAVTGYPFPIQRALVVTERGRLDMLQPEHRNTRSQDLQSTYHDAGQFYWGTAQSWLENRDAYSAESVPILIPSYRVQDIDTQEDWRKAELMYQVMLVTGAAT